MRRSVGVGRYECGNEHVRGGFAHSSHFRIERLSGMGAARQEASRGIVGSCILCFDAAADFGDVAQKISEGLGIIAVVGLGAAQRSKQRAMRFGVGTRIGCGHVGVHELHLAVSVVGAVESQLHLEALEEFQIHLDVQFVAAAPHGGRGLPVVGDEPSAFEGAVDIRLVGEAEREVQTRSHRARRMCLAEYVADVWLEQRQRQRAGVAVAHRYVAWRQHEPEGIFTDVARQAPFFLEDFHDCELEVLVGARENLHRILVDGLEAYGHWRAVGFSCRNLHFLLRRLCFITSDESGSAGRCARICVHAWAERCSGGCWRSVW